MERRYGRDTLSCQLVRPSLRVSTNSHQHVFFNSIYIKFSTPNMVLAVLYVLQRRECARGGSRRSRGHTKASNHKQTRVKSTVQPCSTHTDTHTHTRYRIAKYHNGNSTTTTTARTQQDPTHPPTQPHPLDADPQTTPLVNSPCRFISPNICVISLHHPEMTQESLAGILTTPDHPPRAPPPPLLPPPSRLARTRVE